MGPALNYLFNFLSENDLEDSEAINVFIVRTTGGGTTGFATLPPSNSNNGRGFVFLKALIGPVVKAHELGHYFGLSHTHRGKDIIDSGGNYGPWVKIRNDYTWNPYYHISAQCNPCGSEVDDRLDDTAPDTYPLCRTNENPCEIIDAPNSNVPGDQGGRLYTFEPPTTNIMSYGLDDRVVFSDKQVALMLTNLAEHPNRLYLIDENMPNCQNLNLETDMFYSETSKVVGGKRNANEELVFAPLENMFIKITKRLDNPIGTFQGECEVYTNYDGQVDLNSDGCLSEDLIRQDDKKFEIGQCLDASACIQLSATEGVSTFDIIQIRKHILGIRDFSTDVEFYPYNSIAADVSNNGIISGLDIIQLQKVILGIYTEFPNTPSWRTLPQYAFTDQFETFRNAFYVNPFNAVWEYDGQSRGYLSNGNALSYVDDPITLYGSNPDTHFEETWSFKAIKTGDVNFSNQVPNELDSHDYDIKLVTNEGTTYGDIRDWLFVPGQVNDGKLDCIDKNQSFTIEVVAQTNATIEGYQMELGFDTDDFNVEGINTGDLGGFALDNFYMPDDKTIRTLWFDETSNAQTVNEGTVLFKLYCKATKEICELEDVKNGLILQLKKGFIQTGVWANVGDKILPIDFNFGVKVIAEIKKHQLNTIYPNPISGEVNIEFTLSEPATVEFLVIDAYGNQKAATESYLVGTLQKVSMIPRRYRLEHGII